MLNINECIEALQLLLNCMDDKLQCEQDKITKLIDLKPSSFEYVIKSVIIFLISCKLQQNLIDNETET